MTPVYNRTDIVDAIDLAEVVDVIEEGFVKAASGLVVTPPVGYMQFHEPAGDVHIKYGYMTDDGVYVIKVASGFYDNPKIGLPSSNGLMLVFSRINGELLAVLVDEGYLTGIRTAAAGAVAARYFAPRQVQGIGILGTGRQAYLQALFLRYVTDCRRIVLWGRSRERAEELRAQFSEQGFDAVVADDIAAVAATCNLLVTTTPSATPLLDASHVRAGMHITALGADGAGKQELETDVFSRADIIVADSIEQATDHGDLSYAVAAGVVEHGSIVELGSAVADPALRRTAESQVTVADLTGIAAQDIQIAKYALAALQKRAAQGSSA